jgi:large subunit ribosomal protein L19
VFSENVFKLLELLFFAVVMTDLTQAFSKKFCKDSVPDLQSGYLVKVHQKVREGNKERIQIFEGTVIRKNSGHGVDETFTVRKISSGIGVEKTFPIHSPNIVDIEVLRAYKVRRAKLHFLRALSGKALRLKEIALKIKEKTFSKEVIKEEEVKAEIKQEPTEIL